MDTGDDVSEKIFGLTMKILSTYLQQWGMILRNLSKYRRNVIFGFRNVSGKRETGGNSRT